MKKFFNLISVILACSLVLITATSSFAANYVEPYTFYDDASNAIGSTSLTLTKADDGTSYVVPSVAVNTGIAVPFVSSSDPYDYRAQLQMHTTAASGEDTAKEFRLGIQQETDGNYYYKIWQDGTTANPGFMVQMQSAGTTGNTGLRAGFNRYTNSTGNYGGKLYGKATYSIDFKVEKNANLSTTYSNNLLPGMFIYLTNDYAGSTYTSSTRPVFLYLSGTNNGTVNEERYYACVRTSNYTNATGTTQRTPMFWKEWYTLEMEVDVPAQKVHYTLAKKSDGTVYIDFSTDFAVKAEYLAPYVCVTNYTYCGYDLSFDNITVKRENFAYKNAAITTDENSIVTASVQIGNDVWYDNNRHGTAVETLPKVILAFYDEHGVLLDTAVSEDATSSKRSALADATTFTALSASKAKPDGTSSMKMFIWDTLGGMVPYCAAIGE